MKIAVHMIVFNAASTLPKGMLVHNITSMLPHVDYFLICEGATGGNDPNHWDGDTSWATLDGRSTDTTVEDIKRIGSDKIRLFEMGRLANGKTEMFNVLAENTPDDVDYVWQIDADEFYHEDEIPVIKMYLKINRPGQVDFKDWHFWGDFNHVVSKETEHLWANKTPWSRIFKHSKGSRWGSHEPPLYLDKEGVSARKGGLWTPPFRMYHYSCVVESQAEFKSRFFRNHSYTKMFKEWQKDHSTTLIMGSKTEKFIGFHPSVIERNYL